MRASLTRDARSALPRVGSSLQATRFRALVWGDGGQCPSHSRPHDIAAAGRVAVIVGESRRHLPRLHQQHLCLATSPYPPAHAASAGMTKAKPTGPPWDQTSFLASPATQRAIPGLVRSLLCGSCTKYDEWKVSEECDHEDLGAAEPSPPSTAFPTHPPAHPRVYL